MLKNSAIQIAKSKLVSTSFLTGSLVLIGGIVIWQLWRKQVQLSTETDGLSDELNNIKKQLAEVKKDSESTISMSSSLKKLSSLNPWSSSK